ncbi:MAG: hypothetical protein ABR529_01055 [Actinomycetota bacterium]
MTESRIAHYIKLFAHVANPPADDASDLRYASDGAHAYFGLGNRNWAVPLGDDEDVCELGRFGAITEVTWWRMGEQIRCDVMVAPN